MNDADSNVEGYDYNKISNEKLMKCPEAVRNIVNDPNRFKGMQSQTEDESEM